MSGRDEGSGLNPSLPATPTAHRGQLMLLLGIMSLIVGPPIVSVVTWVMAHNDLKKMAAGQMDPAGRSQTSLARLLAIISTLGWPAILSCCCMGWVANQFIQGGRLVSAIGSRRITAQEFERIDHGMTKKQVLDLVGPPARTERDHHGRVVWHWDEKGSSGTFNIDFTPQDRVGGKTTLTPD